MTNTKSTTTELLAELPDEPEQRHRRALAEGADGVAHDVARDLVEAIDAPRPCRLAVDEAVEDADEPGAALAARRALPHDSWR
jgi:hypothetical protein